MNKLKITIQKFMRGRYGLDVLSRDLSWFALFIVVIGALTRTRILNNIGLVLILISYLRMFSKNTTKRYRENVAYNKIRIKVIRKVKNTFTRIKDFPKYRYLRCPNCNKQLRIPRGKKNITVTCPTCRHRFDA